MMFNLPSFRLEVVPECGSTNEELLAQRSRDDFPGRALLALRQNAGRGRRGREWQSQPGNLAMSMAFRVNTEESSPALLPFLVGLAVTRALPRLPGILLKWPNDIYLNGRKLGGILAQAKQNGAEVDLVVGLGLNLAASPEGLNPPATSLAAAGISLSPEEFAQSFLLELTRLASELTDFEAMRAQWERAAKLAASELEILGEEGIWRPKQLLPSGELAVESSGRQRILAAETVSVRLLER